MIGEVKSCEVCGAEHYRESRWCSRSCYNKHLYRTNERFRARIKDQTHQRYLRIKDQEDYKKKNKERVAKYFAKEENRIKSREQIKKLQQLRRENKVCWKCGGVLEGEFVTCLNCRIRNRK